MGNLGEFMKELIEKSAEKIHEELLKESMKNAWEKSFWNPSTNARWEILYAIAPEVYQRIHIQILPSFLQELL